MVKKLDKLFSSELGADIFQRATNTVRKYAGIDFYNNGVLVGLSGGADSVMLLCFLAHKRRIEGDFPILAVHVNHMIRGKEADRDEEFSRTLCTSLGVEFTSVKVDVPSLAAKHGVSLELAARDARYSIFLDLIAKREDISYIAVAHNATDNIETVLFNLLRGTGLRGASGIAPFRDNVVRPLITVSKSDIVSALTASGINFVTDSSNQSIEYSRNYIRNEILPHLSHLTPDPEAQFTRASEILREDLDYLSSCTLDFFNKNGYNPSVCALRGLHSAILSRVITSLCENAGLFGVEYTHIKSIIGLLDKENFTVSLPSGYVFRAEYGICGVYNDKANEDFSYDLSIGFNDINSLDIGIALSYDKDTVFSFDVSNIKSGCESNSDLICTINYAVKCTLNPQFDDCEKQKDKLLNGRKYV